MINANEIVGSHDILFVTLDTLRLDVAQSAMGRGQTPNFEKVIPDGQWEHRHTPGNFTFAAHQAFFAGFLPTPADPKQLPHPRLFAAKFLGSETTTERTCVFEAPDMIEGLAGRGYHTICIGGVGFFNKLTPLGNVLPNRFAESHWSSTLGVTDRDSTRNQVDLAITRLEQLDPGKRVFLFINVSALHQPNCIYVDGATTDTPATQSAALTYVDSQLSRLFEAFRNRPTVNPKNETQALDSSNQTLCILTSDHGTAYGEDGYHGHRVCHPVVWDVPYAEFVL
ncbi:MAG: STM4013/SEN3800 family hydrolase [Mariniblastus sp.]